MRELVKFKFYETSLQANRDKQILAESDQQLYFIANFNIYFKL